MEKHAIDQEYVLSEVSAYAEEPVRQFVDSLDQWHPFIAEEVRHAEMFTPRSYDVGKFLAGDWIDIGMRIHRAVDDPRFENRQELLTLNAYSDREVVFINLLLITPPNNGLTRWSQFSSEGGGQSVTVESREIRYAEPVNGDVYTEDEIVEVLHTVLDVMTELKHKYGGLSLEEIMSGLLDDPPRED